MALGHLYRTRRVSLMKKTRLQKSHATDPLTDKQIEETRGLGLGKWLLFILYILASKCNRNIKWFVAWACLWSVACCSPRPPLGPVWIHNFIISSSKWKEYLLLCRIFRRVQVKLYKYILKYFHNLLRFHWAIGLKKKNLHV